MVLNSIHEVWLVSKLICNDRVVHTYYKRLLKDSLSLQCEIFNTPVFSFVFES